MNLILNRDFLQRAENRVSERVVRKVVIKKVKLNNIKNKQQFLTNYGLSLSGTARLS